MKLTNTQKKQIAEKYYTSVSRNEVLNVRMSKKGQNYVSLKVFNPTFKSTGYITIGFNPECNELLLMSEIGVHGSSEISKFI